MKRRGNVAIFVPHGGCPHRCAFCDQRGISGAARIPSDDEVAAVLAGAVKNFGEREQSRELGFQWEIAFFGGSFTAIPRREMLRLLRVAQPFLGQGFSGIRVSTRPDAVDDEVLDILAEHGVTAVELGAQSMDDNVLAACGRGHSAADVVDAARRIGSRGLSLGLQMMTGLPQDTDDGALATARALAALRPDTMRVYPTLVLARTPLADRWRAGAYTPPSLEAAAALCARLLAFFVAEGIRVIRLGLHDSPSLRRGVLAGPYHPAFRELCEGRALLEKAEAALAGIPPGRVVLTVARGSASKMAGQRRVNLAALERRGYQAKIVEDDGAPYLDVRAAAL